MKEIEIDKELKITVIPANHNYSQYLAKELNSSYDAEFSQELLDSILLDHHLGDKDSPGNTPYYQSFVGRRTSARDLPVITIYSQPPKKPQGGG